MELSQIEKIFCGSSFLSIFQTKVYLFVWFIFCGGANIFCIQSHLTIFYRAKKDFVNYNYMTALDKI